MMQAIYCHSCHFKYDTSFIWHVCLSTHLEIQHKYRVLLNVYYGFNVIILC